jgi:4-hydroxy-3-methylbut-2-en-1-yl diphosphate reductase
VLIRAHGEPPATYKIAEENNITIIEATCPIVKRLQKKITDAWNETSPRNGQVVIFGKPGHAEVVGLQGQIDNKAVIVTHKEDFDRIDTTRPVHLFSQTTMSVEEYNELAELLRKRMTENGVDPASCLKVHRTICGQVSNREPHLKEFSKNHDVIIFVSGRESSNGRILFQICRNQNPSSYFISTVEEIDKEWFTGIQTVGVCGATSTPKWLIEKVSNYISAI